MGGLTIRGSENLAQETVNKSPVTFGRDLQKSAGGSPAAFTLYGPYVAKNASQISIAANGKTSIELSKYTDYNGNEVYPPDELEKPEYMFLMEFGINSPNANKVALNGIGAPASSYGVINNPWANIANLSTSTVTLSESTVTTTFWSTVEFNEAGA